MFSRQLALAAICTVVLAATVPEAVVAGEHRASPAKAVVSGTSTGLNLRHGPGREYGVLALLPDGTELAVLDGPVEDSVGNQWVHVQTPEIDGWAMAAFLSPPHEDDHEPRSSLGDRIIATARSALGAPYRWGGVSPETGFDCSGFVLWVFSHFGLSLPHSDVGQLYAGRRVGAHELEVGDIVVFKNTYRAGISHTGIYMGDGLFIHAVDIGLGVRISQLWDSYWAPRFVAGVRVAG